MHWKIRKIKRFRMEWNDGRNPELEWIGRMGEYTELEWIGRMGEYIELGCIGMT